LKSGLELRDTPDMSIATIQNEMLGLPPEERMRLIDLLWDSLSDPEIKVREVAWATEAERRIEAFDAGKLGARNANSVIDDLRNSLRK
jgi:putative addiction module component (TIGR02574 family)